MTASRGQQTEVPGQATIADWLAALSHDSPFEGGEDNSVWDQEAPRLALVPILISLLQDADRDVRRRTIAALAKFGEQAQRTLPVLRAALKDAALKDDDESVRSEAVHAVLQIDGYEGLDTRVQHLGLPQHEVPRRIQREVKAVHHPRLDLGVEIHQRVPAGQQVDPRNGGVLHQIVPAEDDGTPDIPVEREGIAFRLEVLG